MIYYFGALLFNISLCDLLLTMTRQDITNHADDNTPNFCGKNFN